MQNFKIDVSKTSRHPVSVVVLPVRSLYSDYLGIQQSTPLTVSEDQSRFCNSVELLSF